MMSDSNFLVIEEIDLFRDLYNFLIEIDESFDKQIYVDSYDFISIIVGAQNMYKGPAKEYFDLDTFRQGDVLVHSFMYHGYLGCPKLLNAHMFEFLEKIHPDENRMSKPLKLTESAQDIIHGLNLVEIDKGEGEYKNKRLEENLPFDVVMSEAANRFKLMYLVDQGLPKKRASYLIDKEIISFETDEDFRLSNYTNSILFKKIYSYLNGIDPDLSKNNFNDALALCQLQEKLDLVHEGSKKGDQEIEIPLFFGRQGSKILRAVKHILKQKFELSNGKQPFIYYGQTGNYLIVQEEDFFIIDSLYNFRSSSIDHNLTFREFLYEIEDFYSSTSPEDYGREFNFRWNQGEDILNDKAETAVHVEFFKKWWRDSDGQKDLIKSLKQIDGLSPDYLKNVTLEYVNREFKTLYESTERATKLQNLGFKFVRQAFHKAFMDSIVQKFNNKGTLQYDIEQEFLTRFSYPLSSTKSTKAFFEKLYKSHIEKDKESNDLLKIEMLTYFQFSAEPNILKSNRSREDEAKLEQLCVMLSVLWIEQEYNFLKELCQEVRSTLMKSTNNQEFYPNYSVALLHAASIIKTEEAEPSDEFYDKVEKILNCISEKFGKETYKAWIGQAFILIKLWESLDKHISIPEVMMRKRSMEKSKWLKRQEYWKRLSSLVSSALDRILALDKDPTKEREREIRAFYATNIYIYIETLNRPLHEFPGDLKELVVEFESNTDGSTTHERYQDTLSRFSERMAAKTAIEDQQNYEVFYKHLNQAIKHAKNSLEEGSLNNNIDTPIFRALDNELHRIDVDGIDYFEYNRAKRKSF